MAVPDFVKRIQLIDEPRLALFDADGVLWVNDIADDTTLWMIGTGRIKASSEKWHEYKRIYMGDAPAGCRYLLTFFEGLHIDELTAHVNEYWRSFMKLEYIDQPVELLYYLEGQSFKIWVVTGSPTDFLFPLQKQMPVEQIVGMDFEFDSKGYVTGRHSGISCAGPGKAEKCRAMWGPGPIQFACGNALLDEEMLRLARDVAWAVHPHPDFEAVAKREGWEIKPSDRPPYGTTGWVTLKEELESRGLPYPPPGGLL